MKNPALPAHALTYKFHQDNTIPTGEWIFVFGSNLAGRHGKGAAKIARVNFLAEYGVGQGPTGHAYAIPTKGRHLEVLPLEVIREGVDAFLGYAADNPGLNFFVTKVGTGLAGYQDAQMGPLFAGVPPNCSLPSEWRPYVDALRGKPKST